MLELGKRDITENSYKSFWAWLEANEAVLHAAAKTDSLINEMSVGEHFQEEIEERFDDIKVTVSYLEEKDITYVSFFADLSVERFFFIDRLLKYAPSLPNWVFTPYVISPNQDGTLFEMEGKHFDLEKLHFYPIDDPEKSELVHIVVVHDDFTPEFEDIFAIGAEFLLINLLGELHFLQLVDLFSVENRSAKQPDLIPLTRLKSYLKWREKEFLGQYNAEWKPSREDKIGRVEGKNEDKNMRFQAILNTDVIAWYDRPAYPWQLRIDLQFPKPIDEIPNDLARQYAQIMENEIAIILRQLGGCVKFAYVEFDQHVSIFYACKEVIDVAEKTYEVLDSVFAQHLPSRFEIKRDKYWLTFDLFLAKLYVDYTLNDPD